MRRVGWSSGWKMRERCRITSGLGVIQRGAIVSGARQRGVSVSGARQRGASVSGARQRGASVSGARQRGVRQREATVSHFRMIEARLRVPRGALMTRHKR
jgi:uncharacterized protein YjbI with pentapeptide repeats